MDKNMVQVNEADLLYLVLCLAEELLAGGQQHLLVLSLDLHLHTRG